jgi:hypothetical protein
LGRLTNLGLSFQQSPNGTEFPLDGLGNLIDMLRLDDGLQILLQNSSEVVLQLGATESADNGIPGGRITVLAKVRLQLSTENLQCCAFSGSVGSNES